MAQAVAHAADVRPRLVGHESLGLVAKTERSFANPLEAALYGVASTPIPREARAIAPANVALDALDVLDNIGQTIGRIMLKRQAAAPDRYWLGGGAFRPAREEGPPLDPGFRRAAVREPLA